MESTIELSVFKKEIHFIKKDILTTGQQRNSMKITFNGKEWDKLTKFGVFKVENVVRYVLITSPDIEIPAEVCTIDNLGKVVYFGIKGTSTEVIDGTKTGTVYNTPYFRLGVLERGTEVSGRIPEYPSSNTLDSAIETARRWAIGPNSTDKVPTDVNNAKYWSDQAQKFAENANKYPRINSYGRWEIYDSEKNEWVDTGVTVETLPIAYQFSINDDGDLILTYIGDRAPNYFINEDGDLIMTSESGGAINLGRVKGENGNSIDITGAKDGDVLRVRGGKVVTEQVPIFIDLNAVGIYVNPDNNGEPLNFNVSQDIVTKLIEAAKSGGALFKFGYGTLNNTVPVQTYLSGGIIETEQTYLFSGRVFFDSDTIADISFSIQPDKDNPKVITACVLGHFLPTPESSNNGAFLRVQNGEWAMVQVPIAEGGTF